MRLDEAGLPKELLELTTEKGMVDLYPPQEEAIKAGLLEGKSLVVASPTACYDDQTEVLTREGWKFFKDTASNEKVLSMNPETFEMEYVKAIGKVEYLYKGAMVQVVGKEVEFRVTENHRMYVCSQNAARTPGRDRNHRAFHPPNGYGFRPAREITRTWRFKSDGIWKGRHRSHFILPSMRLKGGSRPASRRTLPRVKILMNDWLNFLGWYLAEGSAKYGKGAYEVTLCQRKAPLLAEAAIKKLGIAKVYATGKESHRHFSVSSPQLARYLSRLGLAPQKFVPDFAKQLPQDQISILVQSYQLGDGHTGKDGQSPIFGTTSKRLADDVQELLLKLGMSSSVRFRGLPKAHRMPDGHMIIPKHPYYEVAGRRCSEHGVDPRKPSKPLMESNEGEMVYCLRLPKYHLLYVRRNGKALWCGNSGKTLIAIIAAYLKAKSHKGKVVYLAPLRALASEKYREFSELGRFGISTSISTGDYDSTGESLGRADIIVLTNERFDSVMRHRVSWLRTVGLFIADEVHLAGNDSRGPTLEMILTKVMYMGLDAQVLALSATISNADDIAKWLGSSIVQLDWRPVPLREGVYDYGRVVFLDGGESPIPRSTYGPPIDVAMGTVKEGGQALIFASTRRRAVSLATRAAEVTQRQLSPEEKKATSEASRRILTSGEETSLSRLLAEIVAKGAAFHHAGLESDHRKIVEDYYRARAIKLLAATPTLCLPRGEEIFGNPGPIPIQELDAGDRVLTHGNRFEEVIGPTSKPYEGSLVRVRPWFQLPMRMTPEHKVLRSTRTRHSIHSKKENRHWWTYTAPEWVEAKYLKIGDLVLFPRIKDEIDLQNLRLPEIGALANQTGEVGKHWSRLGVDRIELTPGNLEQLGIYVAEGFSGKQGQVHFAFGTHETELTSLTKEWFRGLGLNAGVKDETRHRRTVFACSKQIALLFRDMFGSGAPQKRIPHQFMLLPNHKLSHFIRGMWRGDGNVAKSGPKSARYGTTSRILAKQLFALLAKMGYMPCIKFEKRRSWKKPSKVVEITSRHDTYTVSISGKQYHRFAKEVLLLPRRIVHVNREFNRGRIDDDYYYMPIRKIETEQYSGTVHNLEVRGHSSYVGSFVVHNSAGVNLPARRVVMADMTRYDASQGGNAEISVLEYRQMAGRAGRPQYDDHGETVIIPPPSQPPADLLEHYARSPPEPIESRLADEGAMRFHVLATIATSSGMSKQDLDALFRRTLLALQVGEDRVARLTEKALGYLLGERLVESSGGLFYATDFGKRVSMLYIDPVTGVMFRDAVRKTEPGRNYTAGILRLVAGTPDFEPKFPLRSKDYEQAMAFMEEHSLEMLERPSTRAFSEYDRVLQEMRTVMALYGWIDEWREEQILTRLGVEPGDMHRAVDNADWLLNALVEISRLFKRPEIVKQAELLRKRVVGGVSEELVELTTLQGVGRVRARALYSAGFRNLEDIKEASPEKLAMVEKVGTAVARKIKEQVSKY